MCVQGSEPLVHGAAHGLLERPYALLEYVTKHRVAKGMLVDSELRWLLRPPMAGRGWQALCNVHRPVVLILVEGQVDILRNSALGDVV